MMSTVQKLILFGEFSRGICLQSDAASKDGGKKKVKKKNQYFNIASNWMHFFGDTILFFVKGVEVTDVLLKDKLVANGIHTNITDPNTPINFSYVRKVSTSIYKNS